jgi:transposase
VDTVRRAEHKALAQSGDQRLKGTKSLWLRHEETRPDWRREEFAAVTSAELTTSRAWAIKESLRTFWMYSYQKCAETYFTAWSFWATHSRIAPMIEAAKTLTRHLANILTSFTHRITTATAEGITSKIQMITLRACGSRTRTHSKAALDFHCGGLDLYPLPAVT